MFPVSPLVEILSILSISWGFVNYFSSKLNILKQWDCLGKVTDFLLARAFSSLKRIIVWARAFWSINRYWNKGLKRLFHFFLLYWVLILWIDKWDLIFVLIVRRLIYFSFFVFHHKSDNVWMMLLLRLVALIFFLELLNNLFVLTF